MSGVFQSEHAKKDGSFIFVDFLSRGLLIAIQDANYFFHILQGWPYKIKDIIFK